MQVTSNHEKYVFVDTVDFWLTFSNATNSGGPGGYLFLCPPKHLRTGPDSFAWPQCPWFWSMDPNGDHPLTEKEGMRLGFPRIQMEIEVSGCSWPSSVYEGLRTFHAAKGFDPDSQGSHSSLVFHCSRFLAREPRCSPMSLTTRHYNILTRTSLCYGGGRLLR
ncbi:hypothetical protein FB45DRAFT_59571 [Roridomyces roridus]|uniref:Uncharacterized protein n=1 Tax=Roridomyces roridus TaxID=1738132 RepID=A0AAD7BQ86_9AGAR|nr:hypothetical protein FB45DRAFT_59571 [Roridomyces roridus]